MSQFYFNPAAHSSMNIQSPFAGPSHNYHGARSRRGGRFTSSHSGNPKPYKPTRTPREPAEAVQFAALRKDFEAARSFDLEDDEMFCPWHLLTEDDLHSISSSSSDRSSSSDGSPESSPMQPQVQPTPNFALSATAAPHMPGTAHGHAANLKLHQPMAQRTKNAIPIVDPNSRHTSPPNSISPARQLQQKHYMTRRW